jgi:predicted nucleic acid-binding protein
MPADISSKLIISDTSCLIGLANIGRLEILREVCHHVVITPEVAAEYKDPLPDCIEIVAVKDRASITSFNSFLGIGESSAIALALESENPLLILDDKKARRYAQSIGLDIIGILGLLTQAYTQGLLDDMDGTLAALRSAGFRLPSHIV